MPLATWYDARVVSVDELAPGVRRFILELPELEVFDYRPGQFITFDLPVHTKRLMRWRSYSIAAAPTGTNRIELCIVRAEHGLGTSYLFDEVTGGSTLRLKGPEGSFVLPPQLDTPVTMVCTGTGIAPFRAMLQHIFAADLPHGPLYLIHGTRFESGLLYRDEWEALAARCPEFRYTPVLSRQPDWRGHKGYVHGVYEAAHIEGTHYYLCGWSAMIDEARQRLHTLGVPDEHVKYELYG